MYQCAKNRHKKTGQVVLVGLGRKNHGGREASLVESKAAPVFCHEK
jgi:hypothetical protein